MKALRILLVGLLLGFGPIAFGSGLGMSSSVEECANGHSGPLVGVDTTKGLRTIGRSTVKTSSDGTSNPVDK